jgi:hypothetical protein
VAHPLPTRFPKSQATKVAHSSAFCAEGWEARMREPNDRLVAGFLPQKLNPGPALSLARNPYSYKKNLKRIHPPWRRTIWARNH